MLNYKFCYTCQAQSQVTECVDDYNPDIIPVADEVDKIYPSSPGFKAVQIYRA